MKAESKIYPPKVRIEPNMAILTENVIELIREEEAIYQYNEYRIDVVDRVGLAESIEADFDTWLSYAKKNSVEIKQKVREAKDYLNSTDWYYSRKAETGEDVPAYVVAKRIDYREFIRANEVTNG